eukprot:TRINITY_DN32181_c0_g1_i2.p2 TRINITY_DN32181_c0_g1~~TRINITY_DN32181_c0_g1_i2.p2  ORF type:complete len:258 (-),score=32.28 TRINITY_DN32181_c0_g1_i2:535-1308(-)
MQNSVCLKKGCFVSQLPSRQICTRQQHRVTSKGFKCSFVAGRRGGYYSGEICKASGENEFLNNPMWGEFEQLCQELYTVAKLQHKFFEFDSKGKEIFIEKLESYLERMDNFWFRCKLIDTPQMREQVQLMNVKFLEAGTNWDALNQAYKTQLASYKQYLEQEKKLEGDPNNLAKLKEQAQKGTLSGGFMGVIGLEELFTNPEFRDATQDPQCLAMVKEISMNPWNEDIKMKWKKNKNLEKLVDYLWLAFQKQRRSQN